MKQFMSLSALFLSAACLCAHTPSFASSGSDTLNKAGQTTGAVVGGTFDAAGNVVKSTGNGLKRIGDEIKKGFNRMTGSSKKSSNSQNNSKLGGRYKKDGTTQPTMVPKSPASANAPITPPVVPAAQAPVNTAPPVDVIPTAAPQQAPAAVAPTAGSAAAF